MILWDLGEESEQPELARGEAPAGLLSRPEEIYLRRFQVAKRRAEWILGRHVAKRLCLHWLSAQGERPPPSALTIAPAADGSPLVLLGGGELPLTLSISHRDGVAFCAVVEGRGAPLGADLELCEHRSPAWVSQFFTAAEASFISSAADPRRTGTELWSIKEAALKAARLGLTVDTRTVLVRPRGPGANPARWTSVPVTLDAAPAAAEGIAWARDEGRFVLTLAWLGASTAPEPAEAPLTARRMAAA